MADSSFWDDAAGILATVAPTIATAVGGPLAGTAITAIIGALGLAPDTPGPAVAAAVAAATPDQLLALKKADQDYQKAMKALDISIDQMAVDNTKDARAREAAVKDYTPAILAYTLTMGFFALMGLTAFHEMPPSNAPILNVLTGAVGAAWASVVNYYFGSTRGSDAKTAMLYSSKPA